MPKPTRSAIRLKCGGKTVHWSKNLGGPNKWMNQHEVLHVIIRNQFENGRVGAAYGNPSLGGRSVVVMRNYQGRTFRFAMNWASFGIGCSVLIKKLFFNTERVHIIDYKGETNETVHI